MEVVTIEMPVDRFSAAIKRVTALVSRATIAAPVPRASALGAPGKPPAIAESRQAGAAWHYIVAVACVALAGLVRALLDPLVGDHYPHLTFIVAVTFVAWRGSLMPALVTLVLGGLTATYYFVTPRYSFVLDDTIGWVGTALYLFIGLTTILLSHAQRLATRAAEASAREIRRQQEQVRLSEERFHALLENSSDAIALIGPDGVISYVSATVGRVLGYTPEEFVGRDGYDFVHPDDRDGALARLAEVVERPGHSLVLVVRVQHRDGSWRWIESNQTNLLDNPSIRAVVVNFRDVTARERAGQDLRDREARLRAILDNAVDGIITIDEHGAIESLNAAALRIFGYTADDLLGRNVKVLMPEPYHSEHDQYLDNYVATGRRKIIGIGREVVGRRQDGSTFPVDLAVSEVQLGERRLFTGFIRDITERKRAEEFRRSNVSLERRVHERTAQLEESNKELESFSYSVSHDLRAPLRHISGFADLLQKHSADALDETGRRHLDRIREAARSAGTLIDDLLAFSRMGRAEPRRVPTSMDAIVAEVLRDLEPDTADRDVSWSVDPLPEVSCDPTLMKLVWSNLVGNALKYTRASAEVRVEIGCAEAGNDYVFSVRDNGVGFDMKYAGKLFGVFQRLHTADQFEGTGIGLANVRRIVGRHGGRTWAESELGQGATFFFTLPKHVEANGCERR